MTSVALLSNPQSTGNRAKLPDIRHFCIQEDDVFHYEVEAVEQIGEALSSIAKTRPSILVVNGGDGTVQTVLTALYTGNFFEKDRVPPVAVLPNGKTNLIALDLGAEGDPVVALQKIMNIARGGVDEHIVKRELIALSDDSDKPPVLGMFLGGAGLADLIIYCRDTIYPLGLPNGISHVIAAFALLISLFFRAPLSFLPRSARPIRLSLLHQGEIKGNFSLMVVTTLERLLVGTHVFQQSPQDQGSMKLMMVDQNPFHLMHAVAVGIVGRLGKSDIKGVYLKQDDEIIIAGERSHLILDGEVFFADDEHPVTLRHTEPISFVKLAV
ncbi:MAG: diacylglycerol kinase family protein [Zymomonas mobilis]|uniref:Diacylglycerol kinase-like protein n=1 Tax=Zymomonas mobilis TaxID=542 RepID=A0A542W2A7_ZYMMB|nr:diacylglycerol kinase family protein [Zymomonas mobilis]TQL17722.1 diacylglycerol kinase-like protein [Zymomonas mobilis]